MFVEQLAHSTAPLACLVTTHEQDIQQQHAATGTACRSRASQSSRHGGRGGGAGGGRRPAPARVPGEQPELGRLGRRCVLKGRDARYNCRFICACAFWCVPGMYVTEIEAAPHVARVHDSLSTCASASLLRSRGGLANPCAHRRRRRRRRRRRGRVRFFHHGRRPTDRAPPLPSVVGLFGPEGRNLLLLKLGPMQPSSSSYTRD